MTLRVLDLFSGIGGFALGFGQTGAFELAAYCEIDERAAAVFARHFPGVPNLRDVREVTKDAVEPLGRIDVITGGFPCQDLSVAGRRAGLAGERSGLWFEYHRILDELKPQWVVIENVPGLLSSNGGADFAILLRGLVECGYGVAYRVLDAQYFGLAQRRRRVFIVGSLGDGRAAQVLFEREGMFGHPPARGTAREGVAGGTEGGTGSTSQGYGRNNTGGAIDTSGAITAHPTGRYDFKSDTFAVVGVEAFSETGPGWWRDGIGTLRAEGENRPSRPSNVITVGVDAGSGADLTAVMSFEPRYYTRDNKTGGAPSETVDITNTKKAGDSAPAVVSFTQNTRDEVRLIGGDGDIAGALGAEEGMHQRNYVAPTLSTKNEVASSSTQRDAWYEQSDSVIGAVRRLTPTECERLQGFPDGWTDGQPDSARYRQLGNAVAVPVVRWIAARIAEVAR